MNASAALWLAQDQVVGHWEGRKPRRMALLRCPPHASVLADLCLKTANLFNLNSTATEVGHLQEHPLSLVLALALA